MSRLSGFPELLPAGRIVEQQVLASLVETFELWGFSSIHTRSVEPIDSLASDGEIDKEVYAVRRLHASEDEVDRLALHYDLTVPLARYVVENAGHLAFPFRRYQIQQCWRGERPQDGRYREFVQADIDIVGDGSLAAHHEVEVAAAMVDALSRLQLPPLTMVVNNRKLVQGFYRGIGVPDPAATLRIADKRDKVSPIALVELLHNAGLSDQQAQLVRALGDITSPDASFADEVRALGITDDLLDEGIAELAAVLEGTAAFSGDRVQVRADLSIARGLDYYTGTVFETSMAGWESLGSVCSGGRYDALARSGSRTFPGVGISFGVTRTLVPLLAAGGLTASRPTPTVVLVAVTSEDSRNESDQVAAALRSRGISAHTAADAAKFGAQIKAADRRGIPFVWFPQSGEVKDIRCGDQVRADPQTWAPPAADVRPQIGLGQ